MYRFSALNHPRWYSEGLAELLGAIEITESSIIVGKPPSFYSDLVSYRLGSSLQDVIDVRNSRWDPEYYLTSWLMTHYFLLDSESRPRDDGRRSITYGVSMQARIRSKPLRQVTGFQSTRCRLSSTSTGNDAY